MWLLRLLAVLTVLIVAGSFVAYLMTHKRKYLRFSYQLLRYVIIVALLFFALLILERVAVIPV